MPDGKILISRVLPLVALALAAALSGCGGGAGCAETAGGGLIVRGEEPLFACQPKPSAAATRTAAATPM